MLAKKSGWDPALDKCYGIAAALGELDAWQIAKMRLASPARQRSRIRDDGGGVLLRVRQNRRCGSMRTLWKYLFREHPTAKFSPARSLSAASSPRLRARRRPCYLTARPSGRCR